MRPLTIFGIPVTPPGYYLNSVLTNAQIELLVSDVSVTDYDYGKKKKNKGEFDDTPADIEAVKKARKKWLEKYGGEQKASLAINDIFKIDNSIKINVK